MSELILIHDPILMHRRTRIDAACGQSVRELLPPELHATDFRVIHNGAAVRDGARFVDEFRFGTHDQVIMRPLPRVVTGALLAGLTAAEVAAGVTAGFGYAAAAFAINMAIAAAVSFGMSALLTAIMPTPKKARTEEDNASAVYGWEGIGNTTSNGTPIPLLYGKHRMGGQVLSCFTKSTEDGKNELYMQLALCAGPISAINGKVGDYDDLASSACGDGLKINNNDADAFSDLTVSYRRGDWEQTVVAGFDDQIIQISQNQEITATTYTYTTSDECQAVELALRLPSGLYRLTDRGAVLAYRVQHRVRYRQYGATSWSSWTTITIAKETRTQYNKSHRIVFESPSIYELEIERVTAADTTMQVSTTYLVGVSEINFDDVAYNGIATVSLKALATEELNGSVQVCTSLVHGKKIVVYRPGDDFGADTEQSFTADAEALWGWTATNTAYTETFATNTYLPQKLSVLHDTTSTNWNTTTVTGPYVYKTIYGTAWDVRIRGQIAGGTTAGCITAILMQSVSDATDWMWIGSYHDGANLNWYFRHCQNGTNLLSDYGTSTDTYFRLTRSSSTFTAYTSADGITWTQRAQRTSTDYYATSVKLGLMSSTPSNTTGTHRSNFSEFEFADSTGYSIECSANPAWVIYDLLTDTHYGIGAHIDTTQIDLATFIAFADYCNELVPDGDSGTERRHRYDGVIDTMSGAIDTMQEIARTARAAVIFQADAIRMVYQAPETAVQLFTVGNIKRGTFSLSYQSPKTSANAWEIQFLNAEADYEQDYESYIDPEIESSDEYRCQTTPLYGVTRRSQAIREARFLCRANRLLTTMCSFETGIDAIACEPGNRIEVQFDTPAWGQGGRVAGATSSTITFDHPVTIAAGTTYQVTVRHNTDAIETRTVTTTAGTYLTVAVTPNWTTTPAADEVFAFGQENILTRPFLVTSIERTNDLECRLECVEYESTLYDDTIEDIGEVNYSTLPDPRTIPDNVTALVVTERAQIEKDAAIKNVIDVTYTFPVDATDAYVYWRESGYETWAFAGSTRSTHYIIDSGVVYGTTYEVAVAATSPWGLHRAPGLCPSAFITIQGRTTAPSNVTGLTVTRVGNELSFRWTPITDYDLAAYEIRYGTASWDTAQILGTGLTGDVWTTPNFSQGTAYYLIKAYNTSGIYSATAGSISQDIPGRIAENLVVERDEGTEGWTGTKTQMTVDGIYLDLNSGQLTGTYETPELDCGAAVSSYVACLVTAAQVDLGLTWATATGTWASYTATTWAGTGSEHLTVTTQFRYGNTSGSLGSYVTFVPGQYTGRYFQFKITVTVDSLSYSATVEQMLTTIDVPDYVISGKHVSIAGGGGTTTITWADYGAGFNVAPKVVAVADAGGAGDNIEIVSTSATSMSVRYWNGAGSAVAGYANFVAQGY